MSLDRLCFMLVERQKANAVRLSHYSKFYYVEQLLAKSTGSQRIKDPKYAERLALIKTNRENYRRVADLMDNQRSVFRELRKETGASMKYNARNECLGFHVGKQWFTWEYIQQRHNSYVFEATVLKESSLNNPYAKELYGKEAKRIEEEGSSSCNQ